MEIGFPIELEKATRLIVKAGKALQRKGLVERTWGNVSFRLDADFFAITPSGASYETLTSEDVAKVDSHTFSFSGRKKPSSELHLHSFIYSNFPKAECVLHTHQKWASILSLFPKEDSSKVGVPKHFQNIFGTLLQVSQYAEAGTEEIANGVILAIKEASKVDLKKIEQDVVLMAGHGVVSFAKSLNDAFFLVETLENVSKTIITRQINKYIDAPLNLNCKPLINHYPFPSIPFEKNSSVFDIDRAFFDRLEWLSQNTQYHIALSNSKPLLYTIDLLFNQNISEVSPYFDDVAQIAGAFFKRMTKKEFEESSLPTFDSLLKSSKIILVEDLGALCFSEEKAELIYMANLFEKNVYAFLLAMYNENIKPIELSHASSLHSSYLKGYSLLKN